MRKRKASFAVNFLEGLLIFVTLALTLTASVLVSLKKVGLQELPQVVITLLLSFFFYSFIANSKKHALDDEIKELLQENKQDVDEFRDDLHNLSVADKTIHITQKEFYEYLQRDLVSAKTCLDITHHEPRLPVISGIEEKKKCWKQLEELMKHSQLLIRWIIAVNSREKLEWVKKVVDSCKRSNNVSIHASIYSFDVNEMVPALSLQIVDKERILIIDVARGHHSASELDQDLYSTDRELVTHFSRYFDKYWQQTIPLKEGAEIFERNFEVLQDTLTNGKPSLSPTREGVQAVTGYIEPASGHI